MWILIIFILANKSDKAKLNYDAYFKQEKLVAAIVFF